jgi:ABC-2 type transport system permease protein/lipopolysaccharide transport system permease protein
MVTDFSSETQGSAASAEPVSQRRAGGGARWTRVFGSTAFRDLWEGWRDYRELWLAMGWYDMRKRNRRSVLGPFWITISLGLFILALSVLYGPLLGHGKERYLPYIAFGFITWQFISDLIVESCNVFISNAQRISQHRAPLSIYIYEMVWRNLLLLVTNVVLYLLVILLFNIPPTWATLLIFPAVVIICINGILAGMLFGTLCTRFRDVPPVVGTVMRMMFLLTPILWTVEQSPARGLFAYLNPLYYFVEIMRKPLLGEAPSTFVWLVVIALTTLMALVAVPLYAKFRNRIAYWV